MELKPMQIIHSILIALIVSIIANAITVCWIVGKAYEYEIPKAEVTNTNTNTVGDK